MPRTRSARHRLLEQGIARIRELPGVTSVAVSNNVPVEPGLNLALMPPDGALIDQPRPVDWRYVTPDYFSLFRIATRVGRTFTESDTEGQPAGCRRERGVCARLLRPARCRRPDDRSGHGRWTAGDRRCRRRCQGALEFWIRAQPAGRRTGIRDCAGHLRRGAQAPDGAIQVANRFFEMKWIVRTTGSSGALEPAMREAIRALDPTLAFTRFETMASVIRRDLDMQRLLTLLLGAFATSAMLLAAVGLYGLIAYSAVQRRHEVGVRMALGATASWVMRAFVSEGLVLAGAGLTARDRRRNDGHSADVVAAVRRRAARRHDLRRSLASLCVAVAVCASLIPASSAARTDPMQALRGE